MFRNNVNTAEPIEIDRRTHVLADLERVHKSWTPLGWKTTEVRRIGPDDYLMTQRSPLSHAAAHADVTWMSRLKAIELVITTGGTDDALRAMGVDVQTYMYQPMPLDISHPQTAILCASRPAPNIYDCLIRNCDGRYIRSTMLMRLDPDIRKRINRRVSQREAIAYALGRKGTEPSELEILGILPNSA